MITDDDKGNSANKIRLVENRFYSYLNSCDIMEFAQTVGARIKTERKMNHAERFTAIKNEKNRYTKRTCICDRYNYKRAFTLAFSISVS